MASSFNVNIADLQFMLKQILIAEDTSLAYNAVPLSTLEAIRKIYGADISLENVTLLPFGLRTVDGSGNNLLPGQGDFGAADTLFPRLTDPVFINDADGDQMPLGPPGSGAPTITNNNYGLPGQSVADADPRIISNLIVDMTAGNPAAVEAALKYSVFTGAITEGDIAAAAQAIAAAYALTVSTRAAAAPANVAALLAALGTANTNQIAAQSAYDAAVLADAGNADNAADAAALSGLVADAKATVDALYASIIVDTETPFDSVLNVNPLDVTNLAAAVAAAEAARVAASALVTQLAGAGAEAAILADAQAIELSAIALDGAMEALDTLTALGDLIVDGTDGADLVAAQLVANGNVLPAQNLTAALTALIDQSGQVATTLTALNLANGAQATAQSAYNAAIDPATVAAADAALIAALDTYSIGHDPLGSLVIPNLSPDIGLSPGFNSWMTFFGQFFDHGLDLVTKGNAGTVYIPLQADDPLIAGADGILGNADDLPAHLRFMALTRATVTLDANGVPQHENTTTSWIDQNQTYTSNSSHQVFLREYVRDNVNNQTLATGRLIDGSTASGSLDGAIGNWAEVKQQAIDMLGLKLSDFDVHNVPLLATDQYGKFLPGANGYAQVAVQVQTINTVTGAVVSQGTPFFMSGVAGGLDLANLPVPPGLPALGANEVYKTVTVGTGHAFLNDIAHHAAPSIVDHDHDGGVVTPKIAQVADADIDANGNGVYDAGTDTLNDVNGDGVVTTADFFADDHSELTYDNEMLNSHFITGDGRGNENIALSAVHSVFHTEHNRVVEANKATIIAGGDVAFLNQWLRVDVAANLTAAQVQALNPADLQWDGERLFQAARFSTEMQYQHLVFEEFARRIQPAVDPFVFNPTPNIDPSIVAEFAHTVYRFGHSMLTGTVDRLDNNLATVDGGDQATLLAAFLNPQMFVASGVNQSEALANIVRGTSRDVGNEIDEFIVQDVRSNLLGLPLDLAVLNIARGRDTGIPSLNETRAQLYDAGAIDLIPYTGWNDFALRIKNPLSVVNFIAAYGTHASLTEAGLTAAQMRDAAMLLVFGDGDDSNGVTIRGVDYTTQDRFDFLNGVGAYAGNKGGLNLVDLWIGGLAEQKNEFGGMLGQTFNYIFEYQMESLQFGDRFYYLSRTQGTNFLNQLEPNTFADLVMRNSELGGQYATHLNGQLFVTPDYVIELDRGIAQTDYNGAELGNDPLGNDPILGAQVVRNYVGNGDVSANGHDEGGYLRVLGGNHYVLGGTEGNDRIYGDKGIDTIWGDGGNDYLNGGMESDDVFGGEGDDVIEDPFGDDVLRGNQGNDVIMAARGIDLLFGGEGVDYLQSGQDGGSEFFAGTGDDFLLGGDGADVMLGNEGNDWMEGGGGFDGMDAENSELFFNSVLIGHDVMMGQGDESDYEGESGDDIMVSAGGTVQRMGGQFGFDWSIAKNDAFAVDFDLGRPIFATAPADILRDRFDLVEAASGWQFNDLLTGDHRGSVPTALLPDPLAPSTLFINHGLDQEGINRIDGLSQLLGGAGGTLGLSPVGTTTTFREGNILLGGDGNDVIQGNGGYDILDGDAWLNVRIKIVIASGPNAGTYSAESLNTDSTVAGPHAGKVFNTDINGNPDFNSPAFGGRSVQSLLLDRTINPGEMSIVREIKYDNTNLTGLGWNLDTAVFRGTMAEYDVEGSVDLNGDGDSNDADEFAAIDVNLDGFISVRDRDNGTVGAIVDGVQLPVRRLLDANGVPLPGGVFTDDLDLLKNIELLKFSDQTVQIVELLTLVNWNGVRQASETALPDNGEVIATLSMASNAVVNPIWSVTGGNAPVTVTGGVVTTTAALAANSVYTLTVRATETGNSSVFVEEFITIRTGSGGADILNGDGFTDVIYALAGNDLVNGLGGNDTLFGQAGDDDLNGGSGSDNLTGGIGNDLVIGGTGNDTINYVIGDGFDTVDGGSGTDRLVLTANAGNDTLAVTLDAAGVITVVQGGSVTSVESVTADLDGGTDTLAYTSATAGVTVNLNTGTATGFTSIAGIENVNTNGGSDSLTGDGNNNVLNAGGAADIVTGGDGNDTMNGGAGDDSINGDAGNDLITYAIGGGADTVNGGANTDTLNIITTVIANDTLDVIVNAAGVVTSIEGGSVTSVEAINVNLGQGFDRISYAGSAIGVTVNLAVPSATGFASIANIEDITGTAQADILTGNNLANFFNGGAGNDTMNGGLGNDDLSGGGGLDTFTYQMGGGADNVDGGGQNDTLNIIATGANDTLDVIVNGAGVVTSIEGGSITSVETINVNLSTGNDTISYAGSASGVTVNLGGVPSGTGLASLVNTENVTGTGQADTLTGSNAANILNGGAGADIITGASGDDTINGGAGGDTLAGGIGADSINTGAANDDVVDLIRFIAANEFGDTITNFDANGTVDRVEFGGVLNALLDDGNNDDNILFVTGDGDGNADNTTVDVGDDNTDAEALLLTGANGEGVTNGNLGNAGLVATAFNNEFNFTDAGNGEDLVLVINDTNGTSFSAWQWVQADNDASVDAGELTLIGVINANATVGTASFDFF